MNLQPGTAEHRGASVARLWHAVQRLALEPAEQVAQFPVGVAVADELALDLEHWLEVCSAWGYLESGISRPLGAIDDLLGRMSGPDQKERWTLEALTTDPGWGEARTMAREVLRLAGWPRGSPPKPEDEGTTYVR